LLVLNKAVCVEEEYPSPDYLLSVLKTYQTSVGSKSNDAAEIVQAAFRRAFTCKK
jgi:hypothetical protein